MLLEILDIRKNIVFAILQPRVSVSVMGHETLTISESKVLMDKMVMIILSTIGSIAKLLKICLFPPSLDDRD